MQISSRWHTRLDRHKTVCWICRTLRHGVDVCVTKLDEHSKRGCWRGKTNGNVYKQKPNDKRTFSERRTSADDWRGETTNRKWSFTDGSCPCLDFYFQNAWISCNLFFFVSGIWMKEGRERERETHTCQSSTVSNRTTRTLKKSRANANATSMQKIRNT